MTVMDFEEDLYDAALNDVLASLPAIWTSDSSKIHSPLFFLISISSNDGYMNEKN